MDELRGAKPSGKAHRAAEILRCNDMGGWTRAAPDLYPHQWSWDTGFIAFGLAHLDTGRAARELLHPVRAPVEERQGTPHRLQPGGPAGELLPRPRALGQRGEVPRRPTRAAVHQRPVSAADPRHWYSARLGGGQG